MSCLYIFIVPFISLVAISDTVVHSWRCENIPVLVRTWRDCLHMWWRCTLTSVRGWVSATSVARRLRLVWMTPAAGHTRCSASCSPRPPSVYLLTLRLIRRHSSDVNVDAVMWSLCLIRRHSSDVNVDAVMWLLCLRWLSCVKCRCFFHMAVEVCWL